MTNEFFVFNPLFNTFWLTGILLLVTIILLIIEWIKPKRFVIYRILSVSVAMLSVAMLLLRPSYLTTNKSDQYLILTPNYQKQVVDSLVQVHPELIVATYSDSSNRQSGISIQTRQQLKDLDGKIAFIAGEGLSRSHFNLLQHKKFHYLPAHKPLGITELSLPSMVYPGQVSVIKGKLNAQEPTKLLLVDPAGKIDSLTFREPGEQDFSFQLINKKVGKVLYSLKTITNSTEETFSIPLKVREPEKLEILMLQLAPSFEMRQLKNFLTAQGHGIQVRSQLSKSNFSYEKVNTELKQISSMNDEALKNYDLLIIENSTLEQLSRSESAAMAKATNTGLGVLLLMDQPDNKNKLFQISTDFSLVKQDQDTVHFSFYGSSKKNILTKQKLAITPRQDILPVLANTNTILSAYRNQGFGKVAIQLLTETYQLRLSGDSTAYASIWSDLVSKSSRAKPASSEISVADEFPYYAGAPLTVNIISAEERPLLYYEKQKLPLTEHVLIDNLWTTTLRPQKTGWNSVELNDSTHYDFYVSDRKEWSALRLQQQIDLHRTVILVPNEADYERISRYEAIPSYYFYLSFLLAMGFLWLAPKL